MDRRRNTGQNEDRGAQARVNNGGCDAIPLCLPDNVIWDPQNGNYVKVAETRSKLIVNEEALDKLSKIKVGHVCVVSVAGDYRTGKSFILTKVFNQPNVFSLGHTVEPETLGIWLWIVPEKYQDVEGREFTVVLLDTEGIDSAYGEGFDDHQIFTLGVLLSTVLIFNSQNVPRRTNVDGLDFIGKLSQRIEMQSKSKIKKQQNEKDLFQKTFPHFIWLLRDSVLEIPSDCESVTDYFLKKVLVKAPGSSCSGGQVAESIIGLFSGFSAFRLPTPTTKLETLKIMYQDDSNVEEEFLKGLDDFKLLLEPILGPKKSFNDGEFVTGEGLATLVKHYIEAINDPDAIPNVQSTWDTFVSDKFSQAKRSALETYDAFLKAQLSGSLPGDNGWIRSCHNLALEQSQNQFMADVNGFLTHRVQQHFRKFKVVPKKKLKSWLDKNTTITKEHCQSLLKQLKERHLDPVLKKLREKDGVKRVSHADIIEGYDKIEKDYKKSSKGAKDTISEVLSEFQPELLKEREQHLIFLRQLGDYEEEKERDRAAKAIVESANVKLEEEKASLQQQIIEQNKQMDLLTKKSEDDRKKMEVYYKEEMKNQTDQLENMITTNMKQTEKERKAHIAESRDMQNRNMKLQNLNEEYMRTIEDLNDKVVTVEKDAEDRRETNRTLRNDIEDLQGEVDRASSETAVKDNEIARLKSCVMDLQDQITSLTDAEDPEWGPVFTDEDDFTSQIATNDTQAATVKEPAFLAFIKGMLPYAAGLTVSAALPVLKPALGPVAKAAVATALKCRVM